MAVIPRILKNFNLLVAGQGFAGLVDEIELPVLKMKVEEHRAGGMDGPAGIEMGTEAIECSFSLSDHNEAVFAQFGLFNGNAVVVQFRGAMRDDVQTVPYVVDVSGMYTEMDGGTLKAGDKTLLKASIMARFYRLTVNGRVLIEVDIPNMTRIIDGTDQLDAVRQALLV